MSNIAAMGKVSEGHAFTGERLRERFNFRDSLRANVTGIGRHQVTQGGHRKAVHTGGLERFQWTTAI
jgi:hypothetical protein